MPSGGLPYAASCCDPCETPTTVNVPGANGAAGAGGADGADGVNAFTTTSAAFTMPAELANVNVTVGTTAWMAVGQTLYVQNAGFMSVVSITNAITVVLKNLEDAATSAYPANVAPTTSVALGSKVSPGGVQGPAGSLTGAAGGDLEGTYPNATLEITATKGDIIVNNNNAVAPRNTALSVGADDTLLHADSTTGTGLAYRAIDLSGAATALSNDLAVADGGTGASTATAGFDNLSPLTTRGDIIVFDAANNVRLAVGAASTALISDGTDPSWGNITASHMAASAKYLGRYGVLGSIQINLNTGVGDQSFTVSSTRYIVRKVILDNASVTLAASAYRWGLHTAAAAAGTAIVTAGNTDHQGMTANTKWIDVTLAAIAGTDVMTAATLYVNTTVVHGSAATMVLYVFGEDLS